ncbi:MAG: MBL fold metallo-hydrolase [Solirubrobacteraceae bacterium]
MFLRQILHEDLGCASYFVASRGEALVVDPKWEIDDYLRVAAEADAEIRHVLETHFHADHVSGRRKLMRATGATPYVPLDPQRPKAGGLRDGDTLSIGYVTLTVISTPGHRPEHLAFLLTEAGAPTLLLSGDSLLVGSLARPDLAVDAVEGARALWATVTRLTALGESVEVWPAHVGASLCGSGTLTERSHSTIGEELRTNPQLSLPDQDAFVQELTRARPARPPRVHQVVRLNLDGAEDPNPVRQLDRSGLAELIAAGACVLDVRSPELFDQCHINGALNLPPTGRSLGNRAGWATSPEELIVVVAQTRESGQRVTGLLRAAGVWNVVAATVADPDAWVADGLPVSSSRALAPAELPALLSAGELELVDVRDQGEWYSGHVAGSTHLPLHRLGDGSQALVPGQRPLAVACAAGARAALAASILRRRGHNEVLRVSGGVPDLAGRGVPLIAGDR